MKEADKNFILLSRNIYKCAFWYRKPFAEGQAWIDLLMQAYWTDGKALIGNVWIQIRRGEIPTSERQLMNRWGWGNTRVRDFLKMLETDGMIEKKTDRHKTIIRIVNYDKYQLKGKSQSTPNTEENRLYAEGVKHEHSTEQSTNHSTEQSTPNSVNIRVSGKSQSTEQSTDKAPTKAHINNIKNNNENKKEYIEKEPRHKYGEYNNVLLSDKDIEKLKEQFPDSWREKIEDLSSYMASTGKTYKSHLATIRNWDRRNKKGKEGVNNEQRSKQRELYDANSIF